MQTSVRCPIIPPSKSSHSPPTIISARWLRPTCRADLYVPLSFVYHHQSSHSPHPTPGPVQRWVNVSLLLWEIRVSATLELGSLGTFLCCSTRYAKPGLASIMEKSLQYRVNICTIPPRTCVPILLMRGNRFNSSQRKQSHAEPQSRMQQQAYTRA